MADPEQVLDFWLNEIGSQGWYSGGKALDDEIRTRFEETWKVTQPEGHLGWSTLPRSTLALLIVLDQFPRNMFRDTPAAFSTDPMARGVAKRAIRLGWDRRTPEPERQFFYLPLTHSESLEDQDRAVRLMLTRMEGSGMLLHARSHREVIRRFGRFPNRNAFLGRTSTAAETAFLESGGYGAIVRELKAAA